MDVGVRIESLWIQEMQVNGVLAGVDLRAGKHESAWCD